MGGYLDIDLNDHEFRMNGCVSTTTIVLRRRSPLRRSVAAPACESFSPPPGPRSFVKSRPVVCYKPSQTVRPDARITPVTTGSC